MLQVARRIKGFGLEKRLHNVEQFQRRWITLTSNCNQNKFPWRQDLEHGTIPNQSFLYKFIGLMLLRRAVRNQRSTFNIQEFAAGIEIAVKAIGESIGNNDLNGRLEGFFGNDLYIKVKNSMKEFKENELSIHLEIESVRPVKITRARFICGNAEPGDEHILELFGQQIITSKRKLDEIVNLENGGADVSGTYNEAKAIGAQALVNGIKFQIDVKFASNERFYVFHTENDSEILQGVNKLCEVQHVWCFETSIDIYNNDDNDGEYPLDWQVVNMDELCQTTR